MIKEQHILYNTVYRYATILYKYHIILFYATTAVKHPLSVMIKKQVLFTLYSFNQRLFFLGDKKRAHL